MFLLRSLHNIVSEITFVGVDPGGIALARKRGLVVLVAVRRVVFIVEIVAMQFLFSVREAR